MRLRRLETYGFKSFADRLTFDFEDGITAVIGPNGCGKSNVVDAIKWVIGEQSAKALRGAEMTDVIFNGCASRKGMPFCEVTLTMDQLSHALPGIDGDEAAITRRLFRDGVSQYFLNGQTCRLKDIKEIFLGTGMGTSAYAVIEQGRVGFILESNTKDRRLILEEAAGISRYKVRRRLANRKLERVQQDLQRIGEVLNEVRRRVKSVTKQAQAALRYKELQGQVGELRLAFALEEFGRLDGERIRQRGVIEQLALGQAESAARLASLEAELAGNDVTLVTLEADVRAAGERRAAAVSRRDVADHRAKDAQQRLGELDEQEGEDRKYLAILSGKLETLQQEHQQAERELRALEGEVGEGAVAALPGDSPLARKRAELDAVLAEVDGLVHQAESLKAKQIEAMKEMARITAETGRLESARQATQDRRRRLEDRTGGQAGVLMQAIQAEIATKAALDQVLHQAAGLHIELDERIRERETAMGEASRADQAFAEARHQEARIETSLRLYRDQENRAEGLQRGVRDVLQSMHQLPGMVGLVADLCRIADENVLAIETALGQQAQNLICETQYDAKAAIEFLKREGKGRATFLPLDDIRGGERVEAALLREPGVVGVASRLVDYESRLRPAFEYILGNILVVETLDDAIALRRKHRPGCRIVTRDGEVVNAGGAMTGGRQQGHSEGGGVVSRKHEIAKLGDELRDIIERRDVATRERDEHKKRGFELSLAVEDLRRRIKETDRAVGEAKAQLMKAERDRLHLEHAASGFGAELEEIAAELGKIESEGRELAGQQAWFGAVETKLTTDLETLQQQLAAKGARRDQVQDEVASLRVSAATTAERLEASRNHLGHLTRTIQEAEDQLAERTRRLENVEHKRAEYRTVLDQSAAVYAHEAASAAELAGEVDALIKQRDALRNTMEESRQEVRVLNARSKAVDHERSSAEIAVKEADVRIEGLTAQILESHHIDLAEAFTHYVRPADLDLNDLRQRLVAAEQELAGLGPVNLAAIDELAEVQARQDFLDKQYNDLTRAMDLLTNTIDELNRVCGELFSETYRQVRTNFQGLFRKLFGGGRADLQLELKDEEGHAVDPLEAGLEIVASPPGKNPKVITQLSGGEKALTAIALLFAVYQTKPSPFCILDEVDAPLDEANVDVYNNMIREFTKNAEGGRGSQFIVITHKKRTMMKADAIYGITQNEPGVSTKISVRFEDVATGITEGKDGAIANIAINVPGELAQTVRGAGPFAG